MMKITIQQQQLPIDSDNLPFIIIYLLSMISNLSIIYQNK